MMGTIVLTMLLSWFGVVAVLTLLSPSGEEGLAEESARVTGAPPLAPEEPQSGIGA
jgi:hypothetical protein